MSPRGFDEYDYISAIWRFMAGIMHIIYLHNLLQVDYWRSFQLRRKLQGA